jgi:3-hydroxybutyryl-CoA dehydrogenase
VSEIQVVGIIGAGTMGHGIAQLALTAGTRVVLVDTADEVRVRAVVAIDAGLDKLVKKGRLSAEDAEDARARLTTSAEMTDLADTDLVIEAVPENLRIKISVLTSLAAIVSDTCIIATNTSSLVVSEIAATIPHPERVVGMHFFNPPPIMRLLEVIPGEQTSDHVLAQATDVGERMGKIPIVAADGPGFIVNRIGRPFNLEAQRLIQDGIADAATIDRLCRGEAGFRMGPLELLDLVGIDVGVDVALSFWEQSFGEPRWRPSMIASHLVAAGQLGRKTGQGFYRYPRDEEAPVEIAASSSTGTAWILGETPLAHELRDAVQQSAWTLDQDSPDLLIDCGLDPAPVDQVSVPRLTLCVHSLLVRDPKAVGFHAIAPLPEHGAIELARTPLTDEAWAAKAEEFVRAIGREPVWVGDSPGLVVGRIVSQLINEAVFGWMAGIGSQDDIDRGAKYGLNHPRGPFEWLSIVGAPTVVSILDALHRETGEERYRVAQALRAAVVLGELPVRGAR